MNSTKGISNSEDTPLIKKGKNYFLGIGINDYTSGLSALYNAVCDVERVGQILQAKYDFDILTILTNAQATRSEILRQLRALQNLSKDDSLLIYYSGHGHLAPEDGYWIPVNADADDIHDYIPNAQLRGLIRAIPTQHTLLIADSCYSGSFFPESETKNMRGAADELEKYRSRWAFCSGRHDQKVSDGTAGTHSPFAEALITELERNNRPKVYLQELATPVINRTAGKYRQLPKANLIFDCGDDGGQFVFALKNNEAAKIDEDISDIIAFQNIDTIGDIRDFMRNFPTSSMIPAAIAILQSISQGSTVKIDKPKIETPNIIIPKKFDFEHEMVFVEGGTFVRASIYDKASEKVILSNFSICKYPVTQAQWKAVMGNNPSHFKGDDKCPVESVSWNDCQEFIKKLNAKTFKVYRLPTEAEWEFAARGGNQSKGFEYSGSNDIDEVAWYYANSLNKTHPVGLKKENELGLYDMSGNVWEWCSDWSGAYIGINVTNPIGAITGTVRIHRGGSWGDTEGGSHVNYRSDKIPSFCMKTLGFRLASSI